VRVRGRWVGDWVIGVGLVMGLAACGGAQATPTPIPASAVRPEQPTPVYAASTAFTLVTPVAPLPTAVMWPSDAKPVAAVSPVTSPQMFDLTALQPPPTGMGIFFTRRGVISGNTRRRNHCTVTRGRGRHPDRQVGRWRMGGGLYGRWSERLAGSQSVNAFWR